MSEHVESMGNLERNCPLCGGTHREPFLTKGSLRVVRCPQCGMLFAHPVQAQYVEGSFYDRMAAPYYLSPDKLESDYASVRFARELGLFRRYCRSGSVLDVGCSTGAFLHQLRRSFPKDYTVLGADVSSLALDYAERQGVPVLRGNFLEHDFGAQRFSAITFWAVFEHVAEPRRFLEKAAALLEPGGHCFVLVPNMRSLAVRLLGARYRYIMPEHLNYFTPATLLDFVGRERAFAPVALKSTHFNPIVLWQDWRVTRESVPDEDRARLLKQTTAWKQNPALTPLKLVYAGLERCLGAVRLADNVVAVLRRR
jgi:2-polyprenyl-3-methyl-5-hydroxy-6-metoxy-1,4-benzoquinol methylase